MVLAPGAILRSPWTNVMRTDRERVRAQGGSSRKLRDQCTIEGNGIPTTPGACFVFGVKRSVGFSSGIGRCHHPEHIEGLLAMYPWPLKKTCRLAELSVR
mmetsp:Transcript_47572/g.132659  ORF Transcript_47572/g.132659 Transcript_47572/m.132659 type:complete len:100 (-) Transcript_47572:734-1033(-)